MKWNEHMEQWGDPLTLSQIHVRSGRVIQNTNYVKHQYRELSPLMGNFDHKAALDNEPGRGILVSRCCQAHSESRGDTQHIYPEGQNNRGTCNSNGTSCSNLYTVFLTVLQGAIFTLRNIV